MLEYVYEPANLRVAVYDKKEEIGKITYTEVDDKLWSVDHTYVDKLYSGQGIAGKLMAELVDQARLQGAKMVPVCSYAVREFEKKSEYADVLSKQ